MHFFFVYSLFHPLSIPIHIGEESQRDAMLVLMTGCATNRANTRKAFTA